MLAKLAYLIPPVAMAVTIAIPVIRTILACFPIVKF
jgi:hypothetical protein